MLLQSNPADIDFVRRVLIAIAVVATAAAIFLLADLLLLIFAALLVATALIMIARPIRWATGLGIRWAVAIASLLILAVLGITFYLFGSRLAAEFDALVRRLPQDLAQFSNDLGIGNWRELFNSASATTVGSLLTRMLSWGTTFIGILASAVIIAVGGLYIALEPDVYRKGFLKLFPTEAHPRLSPALEECGEALRRWLGAQFMAMLIVGSTTAIGLSLIGLPSALALGLIAGVAEFVPYIGPIIAAVPALIIAFSQTPDIIVWTIVVLVIVQQVENNVIMPLLARSSVSIPPAVAMFAMVAMGILFGPLGLLLGFPLTVVAFVLIRRLYVHETLGIPVEQMKPQSDVKPGIEGRPHTASG